MVGNEVAKAPMSQRQFGLTLALHWLAGSLASVGRLALCSGLIDLSSGSQDDGK